MENQLIASTPMLTTTIEPIAPAGHELVIRARQITELLTSFPLKLSESLLALSYRLDSSR